MEPISRVELEPPRLLGELELVFGLDEAGQPPFEVVLRFDTDAAHDSLHAAGQ